MSMYRYLGFEKISVPSGSDLNNYKTPGTYYIHSSVLNSISNKPNSWATAGGIVFIDAFSGTLNPTQTIRQYIQTFGGRKYWRNCLNGVTWDSDWHDETYADLPLSAKTYQLGGSQTLSFSYAGGNASCLIFAVRDSNAGIYLCDNWNHVVTAKDFANLNVSISNKTVTIQNNNANMAISIIVLIANNMPLTQA